MDWIQKREASSHLVWAVGVIAVIRSWGPLQGKSDKRALAASSPFKIETADAKGKTRRWRGTGKERRGAELWSISMLWSRCTIRHEPELQVFKHTTFCPLHGLLRKSSTELPTALDSPACPVLRGHNYVPVAKLQPCRLSLPKGSVSSDDRAALKVTGMSHFIHRGFFEDAWNHQLWWGHICKL